MQQTEISGIAREALIELADAWTGLHNAYHATGGGIPVTFAECKQGLCHNRRETLTRLRTGLGRDVHAAATQS